MVTIEDDEEEGEVKMVRNTYIPNQMMVTTLCRLEGLKEDIADILVGSQEEDMDLEGTVLSVTDGTDGADIIAKGS